MSRKLSKIMKILLVGKEEKSLQKLSLLFEKSRSGYDFHVSHVNNSKQAVNFYTQIHPDLILLQTNLREDDCGRKLCKQIRELESERHTGIIFVSEGSVDDGQMAIDCLESGADDYIAAHSNERELLVRVQSVLRLKAMTDELRSANHRLQLLSHTDDLTGLHNMRSFNLNFMQMLKTCRDRVSPVGVIMLDLDHFKLVNDNNNHLVGSFLLAEVGKLIKFSDIFDSQDCPARYGGDEFVVALHAESLEDVLAKAEKLRRLICESVFVKDGKRIQITTSIGVAWIDRGYAGKDEDPIKAADTMLYKSKKEGRNRISSMVFHEKINLVPIAKQYLQKESALENERVQLEELEKQFKKSRRKA